MLSVTCHPVIHNYLRSHPHSENTALNSTRHPSLETQAQNLQMQNHTTLEKASNANNGGDVSSLVIVGNVDTGDIVRDPAAASPTQQGMNLPKHAIYHIHSPMSLIDHC